MLTTILPSVRDGELSPLDSRHHSACPGDAAPCIEGEPITSVECRQPLFQPLAWNDAASGGLQSNILGNNMNNFHPRVVVSTFLSTCSFLISSKLIFNAPRNARFMNPGTDFMLTPALRTPSRSPPCPNSRILLPWTVQGEIECPGWVPCTQRPPPLLPARTVVFQASLLK